MNLKAILEKEYCLPNSGKIHFYLSAGFGLTIFLMLILFSPFGFNHISPLSNKLLIAAGYALIVMVIWFGSLLLVKLLNINKGKLWQLLIVMLSIQFFAGLCCMFYNNIVFNNPSYFDFFIRFQVIVLLMGIFPNCYLLLFMETNYYHNLVKQSNRLQETIYQQVTLHDQNPTKSLNLNADHIICVQSQDNYIKVEWINDDNKISSSLIRATLNSAINALSDVDQITQCHRSYLINLDYVDQIKGTSLSKKCVMQFSGSVIPISRPNVQSVLDQLSTKE